MALDHMRPYVFRIETPAGRGTGVLMSLPGKSDLIGIATAWHVVDKAIEQKQSIRLTHYVSGRGAFVSPDERHCGFNISADLAMLSVQPGDLSLPTDELPRVERGLALREGAALGWCGFPSVAPERLCFFKGCVSATIVEEVSYLVDGVLINGVSGGPAFALEDDGTARLVGIVSAYCPNVSVGPPLPGLGIIRAVNSYGALFDLMGSAERDASQLELPVADYGRLNA